MYQVALLGGIASGKSTVARELARLGARRIDLDQVSRELLVAGTPCMDALCAEFGADLVDTRTGEVRRHLIAERAFGSPERAERLEAIEVPFIERELRDRLAGLSAEPGVVVVEVPLPDRVPGLLDDVDEVALVACPLALRRRRAVARGMDAADFDARAARQPSDGWLAAHATTTFENEDGEASLLAQADAWWELRVRQGAFPPGAPSA